MVTAESSASRVGHITLDRKRAGKPIAGNRDDGLEVAGAGTQFTVRILRHSQRKRGATDRPNLRRMAPVLDPTRDDEVRRAILTVLFLLPHDEERAALRRASRDLSPKVSRMANYLLHLRKDSLLAQQMLKQFHGPDESFLDRKS